jgi:bifunctional UDP-N-acetylglucosamine pyrophosphorylase/glucosamine-1-phosphate N-acetyltransferase
MKKELLVVISRVDYSASLPKLPLPIVSEPNILNHLVSLGKSLKPAVIGLLIEELSDFNSFKFKGKATIIKRKLAPDLSRIINILQGKSFVGDLILLSSDLFLLDSSLLLRLVKNHQEAGTQLTLAAKKVKKGNDYSDQEYFVLPGLAAVHIDKDADWLKKVNPFKPSGQVDIVALVESLNADDESPGFMWLAEGEEEAIALNELESLSQVAAFLNKRKIAELEQKGVFFLSPDEVWLGPEVKIGRGTVIYPSVIIEGRTSIGKDCLIYPHCHIVNSKIGDRVKVLGATVIEECRIEAGAQVGPFSRLRPETRLGPGSRVGNFVEMKKTNFGPGSKAMHLSYLGDATVEENVNIGAGTITCNYDGQKKNKTYIEKEAFIGSGTELVAPVRVGKGAYIAAGSTITEDVAADSLAIARSKQVEKPGWARKRREKLAAESKANKSRAGK